MIQNIIILNIKFYMFLIFNYILSIYLNEKSIVLFDYNSNNTNTLTINNIPYRETSIPKNFNGTIAFEINPGYYNFNTIYPNNKLNWKIFTKWQKKNNHCWDFKAKIDSIETG